MDIATKIWSLAQMEYISDLKTIFLNKIKSDANNLKLKLAKQIKRHILTTHQPAGSQMIIQNNIFGANPKTEPVAGYRFNDAYTFKAQGNTMIVKNQESRNLIDQAINPLDLKWKIIEEKFIISWNHWTPKDPKEKD